jgi:Cu(I)/Ag(I) efflux system periplasmic protein CusF
MIMKHGGLRRQALALAALAMLSMPGYACNDHAPGTEPAARATLRSARIAGDVREVDVEEGTVTLRHDAIATLKMGAMESMAFKATDPRSVAKLKPGDKVRFRAALVADQPTIVEIRRVTR